MIVLAAFFAAAVFCLFLWALMKAAGEADRDLNRIMKRDQDDDGDTAA